MNVQNYSVGDDHTVQEELLHHPEIPKEKPKSGGKTPLHIQIVPAYNHPHTVKTLFSEYTDMLTAGDPSIQKYLAVQHYDEELNHLEAKYGMPDGRLYLAYYNEEPAGCIGLRKIDGRNCEVKRLYVRPAFRGKNIGSLLMKKIMADAKEIGYSCILLDTLPFLQNAIHMYHKFGFYETVRYNDSTMDTSIYMKLDL